MKNQKSLSSVSDEHLVDMLDASILSYNVYVLENTKVKQHQLLEGFREEAIMEKTFALYEEKIKEINKMPSSIEQEGLLLIRKLISYIPSNNLEEAPLCPCSDPIDRLDDSLNHIIPENPNKPYDVLDVIHAN